LIKKNVKGSSLIYFCKEILPLAETMLNQSESLLKEERQAEAAFCMTHYYQIWSLLPTFIHNAVDFEEVVKDIKSPSSVLDLFLGISSNDWYTDKCFKR
jgi:hypothetical protein